MLHFIRARTDVTFQAPLCDKHQCHVHNEDIQMQDVREVCCGEIEGWAKLWTIHQLIAGLGPFLVALIIHFSQHCQNRVKFY